MAVGVVLVGWLAVACGVGAAVEVGVSTAEAGDSSGVSGGQCWGGALSGEPEACFVLEQAQADGQLQVEAVFLAPSGPLYVMLAQSEPVDDALLQLLSEKRLEFMMTPEGIRAYGLNSECRGFADVASCVNDLFGTGQLYLSARHGASLFSGTTSTHDDVVIVAGGMDGRKRVPGWGSWMQLWPISQVGPIDARADIAGEVFDFSDVDMVSGLSDEDCTSYEYVVGTGYCGVWENYGHLGFVGIHGPYGWIPGERNVRYVQLTPPFPSESELLDFELSVVGQAAREVYESGELDFEYVEVKYGIGQLWRWAVILDRFRYSQANTMGIVYAGLSTNGVTPDRPQDIRETISVSALDPEVARAALPEVLPLLGIPVDAVGRIRHRDTDRRLEDRPAPDILILPVESPQEPDQATRPVADETVDALPATPSIEDANDDGGGAQSSDQAATPTTSGPPFVVEDSDGGEAGERVEADTGGADASDTQDGEARSADDAETPVTTSAGLSPGTGVEDAPAPSEGAVASNAVGNKIASDRDAEISSEGEQAAMAQTEGQGSAGGSDALLVVAVLVGVLLVAGLAILGVRRMRGESGSVEI